MLSEPTKTISGEKLHSLSHWFMAATLLAVITLHLGTLLLSALFSYLVLSRLLWICRRQKWLAILLFLALLGSVSYGLGYFIRQTVRALPEIADKSIPTIIQWAQLHQLQLPFTDYDSLKDFALDTVKSEVRYLGSFARFARGAATQLLLLMIGAVAAISLFVRPGFQMGRPGSISTGTLYAGWTGEIERRFKTLYESFVRVMGAQIIISAINTMLTGLFVLISGLPYGVVVIGVTFLCGLVPVVGNIVSNTIIVAIGFTVSPGMALGALIFLVVIHKLEYLLNSTIIGWRIRNPLWLTLVGLIIGERLMGVPGLVLAPVILNYVRLEAERVRVR